MHFKLDFVFYRGHVICQGPQYKPFSYQISPEAQLFPDWLEDVTWLIWPDTHMTIGTFDFKRRYFDVIHWPFCAALFKVERTHWVGCLWFKRSTHNITSSACQISQIPQITKSECPPLVNAFSLSSSLNVQEQTHEWQCKMIVFLGSASLVTPRWRGLMEMTVMWQMAQH